MHKSTCKYMCIIYVCMHVHMYRGKNPYACIRANMHESTYVHVSKYEVQEHA